MARLEEIKNGALVRGIKSSNAAQILSVEWIGDQAITYLAELSLPTRKHLLEVLAEYRKTITVGRQDWKRVRNERPEAMESYRATFCNNVN